MRTSLKKRILLVEDDPGQIDVMQRELEYLGYEVILATNGIEAVGVAVSTLPDLIVMDMLLPKMDGFQATSRLRNDPKTKHIPILAATAQAMEGDRGKCLAAGCDDYIAKPFTYKELGAAVGLLLRTTKEIIG